MSEYLDFLKTVEPTVLGLTQSSTQLQRADYWKLRSEVKQRRAAGGPTAQRLLSAEYSVTKVHRDYFNVLAKYELAVRSGKDVSPVLHIACAFEGHFHAAAPVKAAHAKEFADKDSWLIFWPYFRQLVSDATARMSIPPELLPLHFSGEGEHVKRLTTERKHAKQLPEGKTTAAKEATAKRGRGQKGKRVGL